MWHFPSLSLSHFHSSFTHESAVSSSVDPLFLSKDSCCCVVILFSTTAPFFRHLYSTIRLAHTIYGYGSMYWAKSSDINWNLANAFKPEDDKKKCIEFTEWVNNIKLKRSVCRNQSVNESFTLGQRNVFFFFDQYSITLVISSHYNAGASVCWFSLRAPVIHNFNKKSTL